MIGGIILLVGVLFFAGIMLTVVVRNLLYVCEPNEVLVVAGATSRVKALPPPSSDPNLPALRSRVVGYRSIRGGRVLRIPLFEEVHRLDLTNMIIELSVTDAFSKGGIPLMVKGVANIKIAGEEPLLANAVERFLGLPSEHIRRVAKDTLEGNLRGVLARMTPEEVNDDKVAFAHYLLEEAEEDLGRLGLILDTLQVQHVADDVGYLSSIGRKQGALLQRRSRIAEAEAKANARIRDAENRQTTFERRVVAEIEVIKADAAKSLADWESRGDALQAEANADVQAMVAQATANIDVAKARVRQVQERLNADVIQPAIAEKSKLEAEAKGDAAKVIEHGKASAQALEAASEVWADLGPDATQVFLLQKLDAIVATMLRPLGKLHVNRLTVLDTSKGGDGGGIAQKALTTREELLATMGVDIQKVLKRLEG